MSSKKALFEDYLVPLRKLDYYEGADSEVFKESGTVENFLAQRYKITPTVLPELYSLALQNLSVSFLSQNLLHKITVHAPTPLRASAAKKFTADAAWKKFLDFHSTRALTKTAKSLQSVEAQFESFLNLPVLSPPTVEELLSSLYTSTDPDEIRQLILELEVEEIPRKAEADFCAFLYRYVLENRNQDSHSAQVTVGSAIRKLVVLWQPAMAKSLPLSKLLETGHAAHTPLKLQLELMRTMLLAYEDGVRMHEVDLDLPDRVEFVAKVCVNDIFVNERPYGAAALNALLLLVLMGRVTLAQELVMHLASAWFVELFHDRLVEMMQDFPERLQDESLAHLLERLQKHAGIEN